MAVHVNQTQVFRQVGKSVILIKPLGPGKVPVSEGSLLLANFFFLGHLFGLVISSEIGNANQVTSTVAEGSFEPLGIRGGGIKRYWINGNVTQAEGSPGVLRYREMRRQNTITITKHVIKIDPLGVSIFVSRESSLMSTTEPGNKFGLLGICAQGHLCLNRSCCGKVIKAVCIFSWRKAEEIDQLQKASLRKLLDASHQPTIPDGALIIHTQVDLGRNSESSHSGIVDPEEAKILEPPVFLPFNGNANQGAISRDGQVGLLSFWNFFVHGIFPKPQILKAPHVTLDNGVVQVTLGPSSLVLADPNVSIELDQESGMITVSDTAENDSNYLIFGINTTGRKGEDIKGTYMAFPYHRVCLAYSPNPIMLHYIRPLVMDFIWEGTRLPGLPEGSLVICAQVFKNKESRSKAVPNRDPVDRDSKSPSPIIEELVDESKGTKRKRKTKTAPSKESISAVEIESPKVKARKQKAKNPRTVASATPSIAPIPEIPGNDVVLQTSRSHDEHQYLETNETQKSLDWTFYEEWEEFFEKTFPMEQEIPGLAPTH